MNNKVDIGHIKKNDVTNSVEDDDDDDFGRQKKSSGNSGQSSKTPVLDTYSRDLTKAAEDGKLDPIVGRIKEIERVSQVLSRRKKNSPILIGEPGCVDGNTMITVRKISDDFNHGIVEVGI